MVRRQFEQSHHPWRSRVSPDEVTDNSLNLSRLTFVAQTPEFQDFFGMPLWSPLCSIGSIRESFSAHPPRPMPTPDSYPAEGYQLEQGDQVEQPDPYPTEGYQSATIDPYPTEGYTQADLGNPDQTPQNYPRAQPPHSPEIVSYVAVSAADQRQIASAHLSEKLVSTDPSYKLLQGQYLNDRRIELEEQAERIDAKQSIQAKLEANRQQHGRTERADPSQEKGIER